MPNRYAVAFVAMGLASMAVGAAAVWTYLPPFGGGWWPYVRIVAAIVGAHVGLFVTGAVLRIGTALAVAMQSETD